MGFRAWCFLLVASLSLVSCKTYKRPKNPGPTLYQGYYNSIWVHGNPVDSIPYVTNWANLVHVDGAGFEYSGRRDEAIALLSTYAAQGKKLVVDLGGFFFSALMAGEPVSNVLPLLMNWRQALEPLRNSIHAIQVLDEPRNWMDRRAYARSLAGEDLSGMDPFSQSRYFQRDVYQFAYSLFKDLGVPLSAHFDNVNDMGPEFPIVVVNLYARRAKLERMMSEFYWRARKQGQKLWVTGRAFSAVGVNGECNFHCRPDDVLYGDAQETEEVIRAYGAEVVIWFIYQNYISDFENTKGANAYPRLLIRHDNFFRNFILPHHQQNLLSPALLGGEASEDNSFYILRKNPDDPGRKVQPSMGKALLDRSQVENEPRPTKRVGVARSWRNLSPRFSMY